jgi:MYXO-CTERM domain-containing protein
MSLHRHEDALFRCASVRSVYFLVSLCAGLTCSTAFADDVATQGVVADTFINSRFPNNNNGGTTAMLIGGDRGYCCGNEPATTGVEVTSGSMRGLVKFNMPGGKLANRITMTRVILTMTVINTVGNNGNGTGGTFYLYRINEAWNQGSNSGSGGGDQTGAAAGSWPVGNACNTAGATWNAAKCGTANWSSAGGGSLSYSVISHSTAGLVGGNTFSWDTGASCASSNLCSDVLGWINGTLGNNGWLIYSGTTEGVKKTYQSLGTAEGGSGASLQISFKCQNQFLDTGNSCDTCTSAAISDCQQGVGGNVCVDNYPTSNSYKCTCGGTYHPYTAGDGNPGCFVNCTTTNHCRDNGDPAAMCTDSASSPGYTCVCGTGYVLNGSATSCVQGCNNSAATPQPCGNGGTCHTTDGGTTWTCMCPPNYESDLTSKASCVAVNGCTERNGNTNCVTVGHASNSCALNGPGAYLCTCNDPAYVADVTNQHCVNKDECMPTNHCTDGGDSGAVCGDHPAPATGYDCTCSSDFWTLGAVGGFDSCVDVNECLTSSSNPCVHGSCVNIPKGGGYSCNCDPPYVSTKGKTPTCVPPGCSDKAFAACATSENGNACVPKAPPQVGYKCTCHAKGYVAGTDSQSCVPNGGCDPNHCIDGGDENAGCTSDATARAGYTCTCDDGYAFDNSTCSDINECQSGGNPCIAGTCSNTKGGYECICPPGYTTTGGTHPTCVISGATSTNLKVTTSAATGCGCTVGEAASPARSWPLLLIAAAMVLSRRRRWGR